MLCSGKGCKRDRERTRCIYAKANRYRNGFRKKLQAKEAALLHQQELLAAREQSRLQDEPFRQTDWNREQDDQGVQTARYRDSEDGNGRSILASTASVRNQGANRKDLTLSMQTPYRTAPSQTAARLPSRKIAPMDEETGTRPAIRQVRTTPPTPLQIEQTAYTDISSQPLPPAKSKFVGLSAKGRAVKQWSAEFVDNVGNSIGNSVNWIKNVHKQDTDVTNCGTPVTDHAHTARNAVAFQAIDQKAAMQSRRLPNRQMGAVAENERLPSRPRTFQNERSQGLDTEQDNAGYFVQQAAYEE